MVTPDPESRLLWPGDIPKGMVFLVAANFLKLYFMEMWAHSRFGRQNQRPVRWLTVKRGLPSSLTTRVQYPEPMVEEKTKSWKLFSDLHTMYYGIFAPTPK